MLPRLCEVNIESLAVLDGRGRPDVVELVDGAERREESVEVKARFGGAVLASSLDDLDRG